jgi:putative ABC transport system permease protein
MVLAWCLLGGESMLQDLIVGLRTLAKRPGYAASVIVTLALGIGATTMMFGLVDAALLRPLPFRQPGDLVLLTGVAGPQRAPRGASFPEAADWRAMNATLEDVAIFDETSLNLRVGDAAARVEAEIVSWSYFPILGVTAAQGRTFLPTEDDVPDAHPVAVVSHRFWRERLGSAPDAVGSTITLNERSIRVVGVLPEQFAGVAFDTDVWIPTRMVSLMSPPAILQDRGTRYLAALGRLKPGVTRQRAQDDLTRVARLLEQQYPDTNRERGVDVDGLRDALLGDTGAQVRALFGGVLLFLAVASANAAGLQVVRAAARRRELALRFALGARRWHVLRQLLVESSTLALAAGILGALCAAWATGVAIRLMPDGALPQHVVPRVDPRALVFTLIVSVTVGAVIATISALSAARTNLVDALKQGGRTLDAGLGAIRRPSTHQILVGLEIAAAMVLLTLAALVVTSLDRQNRVKLGFEPADLTVARLTLPAARYSNPDQRVTFVRALESALAGVPGVRAAAIGSDLPLMGAASAGFMLPDTVTQPDAGLRFYRHIVTPGYFKTLGIPLVAGRDFSIEDRRGAPLVAIVSEAAARRIWGAAPALGRRIRLGRTPDGPAYEVIGVAATVRFRDLTTDLAAATAEPDVYFPFGQLTSNDLQLAMKSMDAAPVSMALIGRAVAQVDPGLPLYRFQPMTDAVRRQTSAARFVSAMLSVFSGCALLLAAVGLYTLVAYVVSLSRAEIAIRLALGAARQGIVALILRNSLVIVGAGIAVGSAAAYVAGRAVEAQLVQTSAADPATYVMVAAVLLVVTVVATVLPTRRAIGISPQAALRE